jgi:putative membrane protein
MYTKPRHSLRDLILWTRNDILLFLAISAVPVILYEMLDLKWLRVPWLPVALIGTAVAFVISFQNNAAYDRVREARKIWGGIVNTSRAWGIMVNDFVNNDVASEKVTAAELAAIRKELVYRHIAWLTVLRHEMRQERPWEVFMRSKTNREWVERIGIWERSHTVEEELAPYLSEEERRHVDDKSNKAAQILALQSKHLHELRRRDLIEHFRHLEMEKLLVDLLAFQGQSERIKNFPYPRQYATLNGVILWIFIILVPFGVMFEFDRIGEELTANYPFVGEHFVWVSVFFSTMVMWVFHTMERMGRSAENPFEGKANDIPITTMSRGIEIDLREMLNDPPESIPAPFEPQYDTLT